MAKALAEDNVKVEITGTGNVIQEVAKLKVENLTGQRLDCEILPAILESSSGKNQDYACLDIGYNPGELSMGPHDTRELLIYGVCINRSKPPVPKGVTGELIINVGDQSVPPHPNSHISPKQARDW